MVNNNYKTAIKRGGPSAPLKTIVGSYETSRGRNLLLEGIRDGRILALDYGCGRGEDADWLNCDRYDPHWYPSVPMGPYDYIFCTYVLNVVDREEQFDILGRIQNLIEPGGIMFVTVRRDIDTYTSVVRDGYEQRSVHNDDMETWGFRSWHLKRGGFEIYKKQRSILDLR